MATGGQLEATSEEFIEYKCTVCLKNNKIKNADCYCYDCQKYMCSECLQIHNNFGDKHNVLSVTDKKVQNVLTEKCEDHPDKVLEYFCPQHDVVVCQACRLDHRACTYVKHIGKSSLVKKNKFNISTPQDRRGCSCISSCCCLDDGTIFFQDATNEKLKRLDPVSNTVTDVLSLSMTRAVYGLCSVGPQEVALGAGPKEGVGFTLPFGQSIHYIQFYDVSKGTETKSIHVDDPISSLACHSGYLFVGFSGSLHVYNIAGERKQDISKDSSGRSLFSSLESIAVNKGGDRIYVADRNMGLICLSRDGQEIFRLTNEQLSLSKATGVTTDHRNQVLICGYDSQNLVQVTEKGRVIGEILSVMDGIKNPRCLCFDDVRLKLYVGGDMGHVMCFDFM